MAAWRAPESVVLTMKCELKKKEKKNIAILDKANFICLKYQFIETLRIFDSNVPGSEPGGHPSSPNKILDNIRAKSTMVSTASIQDDGGNIPKAETQSAKMKALMNRIKQEKNS